MAPQEQGYGVVWQDMLVHEFTSPVDMGRLHYKRKLGRAYSRKVAQELHIGTTVNLYLLKELYITRPNHEAKLNRPRQLALSS